MGAQTTGSRMVARMAAKRLRDSFMIMGNVDLQLANGNFHY
jgi:hypothetical protein